MNKQFYDGAIRICIDWHCCGIHIAGDPQEFSHCGWPINCRGYREYGGQGFVKHPIIIPPPSDRPH